MPTSTQRKRFIAFTDGIHYSSSDLLTLETEVKMMVNVDDEKLGVLDRRLGNTKKGDTLTSSTSTTTSTTTSTSTSTSTTTT